MRQLSLLYTGNQQCYSVCYSPFDSSLLACVTCDKFGWYYFKKQYIFRVKCRFLCKTQFFISNKYEAFMGFPTDNLIFNKMSYSL